MQETNDDRWLLRDYTRNGSGAAFAELVRRHRDFVYAVCLRDLGNRQWAEDATQVVFLVLARRAASVRAGVPIRSWLFTVSRLSARDVRKREMRHACVSAEDLSQVASRDTTANTAIATEIDTALERLRPLDRELVLRRFVDGMSFAEAGQGIGISEEAARKRVFRSLDKLRRSLTHVAGVSTLQGLVIESLSQLGNQSAPPYLGERLVSQAHIHAVPLISAAISPSVYVVAKGITNAVHAGHLKALSTATAAMLVVGSATTVTVLKVNSHPSKDMSVRLTASARIASGYSNGCVSNSRTRFSERVENTHDVLAAELNPLASPAARERQAQKIIRREMMIKREPKGFAITITATLKNPLIPPVLPGIILPR